MAFATINTAASGGRLLGRIGAFAGQIRAALTRRAEYRRTVVALDAKTDRELDDLGISRAEIPRVAAWSVR